MKFLLSCLALWATVTTGFAATCPDGSSCTDDQTCCAISDTHYGCCPIVDAVCCDDRQHCCPPGFTCAQGMCTRSSHTFKGNSSIVCPGGQYTCDDGNTCCQAGEAYTCCPLPDATCCSDGAHCCPQGTSCDLAHETCNVPITKIASGATLRHKPTVVVCPGGEYQCPDDTTCCMMESGEYGCCPLPDAVCCEDKMHCCPTGYTCNVGTCTRGVDELVPTPIPLTLIRQVARGSEEPRVGFVVCPDGSSECPDGNTCCMLSTGEYGCCPMEQAECCSDHIHCCPNGMHCDVAKGGCAQAGSQLPDLVPWMEKVPAIPRRQGHDLDDETSTNGIDSP